MVQSPEDFEPDDDMPRLTISLSAPTHRALKEASGRQGRSMGAIRDIVARARTRAGLETDEATAVAVREARLHREGR